eukprot:scaffold123773_cov49-Attheya_sp.AAC.3
MQTETGCFVDGAGSQPRRSPFDSMVKKPKQLFPLLASVGADGSSFGKILYMVRTTGRLSLDPTGGRVPESSALAHFKLVHSCLILLTR